MAQGLPPPRAIHVGRVIQLGWDALEPCQVDDDPGADAPDPDQDQGGIDKPGIVEPVRRMLDPDETQELVHPACLLVEHPLPDEDAGDEGDHIGQEEEDAEERRATDVAAIDEQCDGKWDDQPNWEREGGVLEGDQQRAPCLAVAE